GNASTPKPTLKLCLHFCISQRSAGRIAVFGIAAGFALLLPYIDYVSRSLHTLQLLEASAKSVLRARRSDSRLKRLHHLSSEMTLAAPQADVPQLRDELHLYGCTVARLCGSTPTDGLNAMCTV